MLSSAPVLSTIGGSTVNGAPPDDAVSPGDWWCAIKSDDDPADVMLEVAVAAMWVTPEGTPIDAPVDQPDTEFSTPTMLPDNSLMGIAAMAEWATPMETLCVAPDVSENATVRSLMVTRLAPFAVLPGGTQSTRVGLFSGPNHPVAV